MRLRGTTGSALEEIGEDTEGVIEDFSKLNKKIQDLTKTVNNPEGVTIVDKLTGGYKSTYQILLEIAKVWKDIGDMQKAEILEVVAGKVRGSAAAAIFESPELLEKAYQDASKNAVGAGDKAIEASLDSIEKKTTKIQNNFQRFSQELFESEGVKRVLDAIIDFTGNLDVSKIQPLINAIESILSLIIKIVDIIPPEGIIGAIFGMKYGLFSGTADKVLGLFNKQTVEIAENIEGLGDTVDPVIDDMVNGFYDVNDATENLNNAIDGSVGAIAEEAVASETATGALEAQATASKATAIATGLLKAAITSLITIGITKLLSALNDWAHAEENSRKELQSMLNTALDSTKQFQKQNEQIDEYISKYKEYYKVLEDDKSTEEDLYNARSNLYDLQQDIIGQYNGVADKIDLVNGKYQKELDLLKGITAEQRNTYIGENAKTYEEAIESEGKRASYMDWYSQGMGSYGKEATLLSSLFEARGYDIAKVTAEEYKQILNELIASINDDNLDVMQTRLAELLNDFSDPEWERQGMYPERLNNAAQWFKDIIKIWNDELSNESSQFNTALKSQEFIKNYQKQLTLNDTQYGSTYQALEDVFIQMQEAKSKEDRDAFNKAQQEFLSLYNGKINDNTSSAIANTYHDLFSQAENLINEYYGKIAAAEVDIWDVVDLVFKQIEKGYTPQLDAEGYAQALTKILSQEGKAWDDIAHEIEMSGYDLDGFLAKYKQVYQAVEKMSFSDWLSGVSSFKKGDKALLNSDLLKEYESAIGQFKEFLVNDREGKAEITLSDILTVTGDPDSFFKAIGMPNFEEYMKKFGNDTSLAMMAYMSEVGRKVEDTFGDGLSLEGLDHLHEQMQKIMIEATGFDPSINVHKIEESYRELVNLSQMVEDGYEFSSDRMDELIEKYPELKSGIDTVTKSINTETGEVEVSYTIQENAIKGLVSEYATLSNEAIDAWRIIKRETLEASIANLNNLLSLERIFELYHQVVDNQDYRGENVFGINTGEITQLIKEYEAEMKLLDDMKKNPNNNYAYKPNHNDTDGSGSDDGDKDNKSRYDWLDSYLEKRNRNLQKEQTAYENLGKQIVKTGDIETQYTENQNKSLEEQNRLLDEQIAAYKTAEEEYGRRMKSGLLYDDLVSAFDSKAEANKIVKRIENREDINLAEYTSEQQSAITAMMDNYNKKLDAADKQLEAQNQKRENSLQMFTNNIELITKKFDHVLNEFANRQEQLEHYQTMRTNAGFMENQKYYIALLDNESRELNANIEKRQTLIDTLKELKVETADDLAKWWETKDAIDATTKAIYENEEAIESYKMSMKQLSWDLNDRIRNITGNLRNETEFLMDTLGTFDADMYDYSREYLGNDAEKTKIYSGKMSDVGLSTMAMRRVRMESFMEDIQALNDEIDQVEQEYLENTANTTILDRLTTLRDAQQDLIKSYNQEREAIVSLVQDGYDKQLQSLDAISNKYLEAAEQAKALYDRQRDLKKQTKTLSDLRKQLQAYSTDSSEEARAKTQSLTVQLQEAEENLADTQYQHQLDDQRQILDHLYQALEDYFNDKLENQIQIIDDTKQLVNDNMPKIKDTLSKSLDIYQTDISQSLKNILSDEGIGAVNSNIAAVDGDVRGITASVTQQTAELERYLAENEIGLPPEETLQDRINKLYGEESTAGSFANYFRSFNDKLTEINNSISKIDLTSKLEDAGKNLADSSSNILDKYLGNKNTVSSSVGTATSITTGVATGIVKGLGKGTSVGSATNLSSTSIASGIINAVKKKYASGVKRLSSGELAWTQEDGLEAILRPTDNAILTPLKAGDSVLTAEATQNLWNFANNPLAFMKSTVGVPNSVSKNNGVTFNNAMSPTIIVNGVSNANEFIRELQKNKQFESMMQDMTVNLMNGGASLSKLKYKF